MISSLTGGWVDVLFDLQVNVQGGRLLLFSSEQTSTHRAQQACCSGVEGLLCTELMPICPCCCCCRPQAVAGARRRWRVSGASGARSHTSRVSTATGNLFFPSPLDSCYLTHRAHCFIMLGLIEVLLYPDEPHSSLACFPSL
jgi:hypothetical protein